MRWCPKGHASPNPSLFWFYLGGLRSFSLFSSKTLFSDDLKFFGCVAQSKEAQRTALLTVGNQTVKVRRLFWGN